MALNNKTLEISVLVCDVCTTVHGSEDEAEEWGCTEPLEEPLYAIDAIVTANFQVNSRMVLQSADDAPFPEKLRGRVMRVLGPAEYAAETKVHAQDGSISRGENEFVETGIIVTNETVAHAWFYEVEPQQQPKEPDTTSGVQIFQETELKLSPGGTA